MPTLAENLALDEALLLQAENGIGGEVLRFWEWPSLAVVLGASGQVAADVEEARRLEDAVPLARRASGGGTVLLGPGCLMYALVLSYDRAPELRDVTSSYRWIMGRMQAALQAIHPDIEVVGVSDLAIAGRKFSGNAQQRKSRRLLHHGTLLYAFDLSRLPHYLKMPQRQPGYRQEREHIDFVCNLPTDSETLKHELAGAWQAHSPPRLPFDLLEELLSEKYRNEAWVRRR